MKISVSITIEENTLERLDFRAKRDSRTRSNMIEQILKEALKEVEISKNF